MTCVRLSFKTISIRATNLSSIMEELMFFSIRLSTEKYVQSGAMPEISLRVYDCKLYITIALYAC